LTPKHSSAAVRRPGYQQAANDIPSIYRNW